MKLTASLHDMGFLPNPYDLCIMNKIINVKKCAILWHVDNLNILNVEPDVVLDMLKDIYDQYIHIDPPTINCGKINNCLGITIDFSSLGKEKITMVG